MKTVVIQSVMQSGDAVTVIGTVDGVAASATTWQSYLSTLASDTARMTYIAQLLVDNYNRRPLAVPALEGTVSI